MNGCRRGLAAALLAAGLAAAQQPSTNAMPLRAVKAGEAHDQDVAGFRAPTYDKDGRMSSQVFGDFAHARPDGYVDITGLRVEFYDAKAAPTSRVVDMTVHSEQCMYHRDRKTAASKKDVRIVRDDMVITGTGFIWESDQQVMQILHDAKVVLKNARRDMQEGIKP